MLALVIALAGALFIYSVFQIARSLFRMLFVGMRVFSIAIEDDLIGGLAGALAMLICIYVLLSLP